MPSTEVTNELAEALHEAGPEATSVMLRILYAQRAESDGLNEQIRTWDQEKIERLEAENAALLLELTLLRERVLSIAYGEPVSFSY